MRLAYGKASLDTVRRSLEALHAGQVPVLDAAAARYRALAVAATPAACADAAEALHDLARRIAAVRDELLQGASDFTVAAAREETRRIRALEAMAARRRTAWRRLRTEIAAVEAWTDAVMDLADSVAARLAEELHARFEAALHDAA